MTFTGFLYPLIPSGNFPKESSIIFFKISSGIRRRRYFKTKTFKKTRYIYKRNRKDITDELHDKFLQEINHSKITGSPLDSWENPGGVFRDTNNDMNGKLPNHLPARENPWKISWRFGGITPGRIYGAISQKINGIISEELVLKTAGIISEKMPWEIFKELLNDLSKLCLHELQKS